MRAQRPRPARHRCGRFAEAADLPAPDAAYSLDAANTTVQPYALYRIELRRTAGSPLC